MRSKIVFFLQNPLLKRVLHSFSNGDDLRPLLEDKSNKHKKVAEGKESVKV